MDRTTLGPLETASTIRQNHRKISSLPIWSLVEKPAKPDTVTQRTETFGPTCSPNLQSCLLDWFTNYAHARLQIVKIISKTPAPPSRKT